MSLCYAAIILLHEIFIAVIGLLKHYLRDIYSEEKTAVFLFRNLSF